MEEHNDLTIYKIGDYIIGKELGHGSTAVVFLGIHMITGMKYAIKIIKKSTYKQKKPQIDREIIFMKIIRSSYIVQLHKVYENSTHLFIVLDYMEGGELYYLILTQKALDITTSIKLFCQVLRCLSYLHSKGICHRDIKPENILLDSGHTNIKLVDFGYSFFSLNEKLKERVGTPDYVAPEVNSGNTYDPFLADVYSCGELLHVMLYGSHPCFSDGIEINFPDNHGSGDLLSKMLQRDPSKRITLQQVMKHPFVKVALDNTKETPIAMYSGPVISFPQQELLEIICYILPNISELSIRDYLASPGSNTVKEIYRLLENQFFNSPKEIDTSKIESEDILLAIPTSDNIIPNDKITRGTTREVVCENYDNENEIKLKINQICDELRIKEWTFSTINGKDRVPFEVIYSKKDGCHQILFQTHFGCSMFKDICCVFHTLLNK
ncbi:br serine/threonine protein kinase, putative [Entamoeba dispar SAW760]|uniref:non-specific serine/threonine protein kinase n=1 Tax=Entamoeba dispar (strain ATCC PRA-260 / SAW760) TaxID=370354 RepID=B0EV44_ENTDS|nr:br serine/threonine protein kinase, putative [Entamoeba dispar SAW760]EDR21597.1 br serine/threonine protein kinase, putative [Entamoeba dispar SAW760]|eukprot:EDR21597.1 br serine/threonine protein kinase, putative [Entamoeba dispar SAW760]